MTTSILAPKVRRTARPSLQNKVRLRPRPLCEGDWSTLPAGKRGPAVIAFGDVLESLVPAAAKMKAGEIRFCKPSFYADAHLWEIDVQIAGAFAGVLDLLVQSDRSTVLNGTSPPIYMLNILSGVMS